MKTVLVVTEQKWFLEDECCEPIELAVHDEYIFINNEGKLYLANRGNPELIIYHCPFCGEKI